MAAYIDLYKLALEDAVLQQKVTTACVVAAEAIRGELGTVPNHANRLIWAAAVFVDPRHEGLRMLWAVLAANSSASVSTIQGASDATIQTNVNAAVDLFATGP